MTAPRRRRVCPPRALGEPANLPRRSFFIECKNSGTASICCPLMFAVSAEYRGPFIDEREFQLDPRGAAKVEAAMLLGSPADLFGLAGFQLREIGRVASFESLKVRERCGSMSLAVHRRCTLAGEIPAARAIVRQLHRPR